MNKIAKIEDICAEVDAQHEQIIELCSAIMQSLANLHNLVVRGNPDGAVNMIEHIEIDVSDIKDLLR